MIRAVLIFGLIVLAIYWLRHVGLLSFTLHPQVLLHLIHLH